NWGLGESVVSGRFMPDRYQIARDSGFLADQKIADKYWTISVDGMEPTTPEKIRTPCLDESILIRLAELGKFVEQMEEGPRDIEWAFDGEQIWLLQSRPITSEPISAHEKIRQDEIERLRQNIGPRGTIWSRFNLSEILPFPTPMTWSIVQKFLMSGSGGFGLMYRDLGYDPHPSLDVEGVYELIGGRPYCNLSKEAKLHDKDLPLEHSFQTIKKDPSRAYYPSPALSLTNLPWSFWALLPISFPKLIFKFFRRALIRQRLLRTFPMDFREKTIPSFLQEIQDIKALNLQTKITSEVIIFLENWCEKCLKGFARESLKATALSALSLEHFQRFLAQYMGISRAKRLSQELIKSLSLPDDVDFSSGIREFAGGFISLEQFLTRFGHRGSEEMELSKPRWREDPSELSKMTVSPQPNSFAPSTTDLLKRESQLSSEQIKLIEKKLKTVQTFLSLREMGKHYLLHGYAVIRDVLLNLDKRYNLGGDIFFLTFNELLEIDKAVDLFSRIKSRKKKRKIHASMEMPSVIFSDDLDAIGRPSPVLALKELHGIPLSAGIAEGNAVVLDHPNTNLPLPNNFILICPSTDPSWVPLFMKARAVAMESGGILSHGAIVARELGLPAVGGIPDLLKKIRSGSPIRINGMTGKIELLDLNKKQT
ncbi:MAG: PEP-utilizing enzyme, partial [Gemmataceae bacterium]